MDATLLSPQFAFEVTAKGPTSLLESVSTKHISASQSHCLWKKFCKQQLRSTSFVSRVSFPRLEGNSCSSRSSMSPLSPSSIELPQQTDRRVLDSSGSPQGCQSASGGHSPLILLLPAYLHPESDWLMAVSASAIVNRVRLIKILSSTSLYELQMHASS